MALTVQIQFTLYGKVQIVVLFRNFSDLLTVIELSTFGANSSLR